MKTGFGHISLFRLVHAGGNLNNGGNAGVACRNSNNALGNSNSNNGSQLSYLFWPCDQDLATGQNIKKIHYGCWYSLKNGENSRMIADYMKRIGNLYPEFRSEQNIRLAIMNARKGKKHYREVKKIDANLDYFVLDLKKMLENREFKTSNYEIFTRKSGGKVREIFKLPYYPDRIVHHCIIQVIQQTWMDLLIRDTFSTIPGRGIHDGVNRIKAAMKDKEGTKYCLKLDIKKYYPNINHAILKRLIRRKIKDKDFLNLLDEIIDSAPGVPIGNYVSQWFGNLYLAYFDHWVKEELKCKYYYRYCDDLVILGDNKNDLREKLKAIKTYLRDNLELEVKLNYQVFPVDSRGLDFLGYRFFHGYTLVRKRIVKAMKKKLNHPKSMASYWGWLKHADAFRLTKKYIDMKKFSEFAEEKTAFEGEKIKIDDVLNKPLEVLNFRVLNGKYQTEKCLQVQVRLHNVLKVIFTGSKVLTEQLEKYEKELPFETTIVKPHRYYTFS
jgi:RNA-directed DNA polymerase